MAGEQHRGTPAPWKVIDATLNKRPAKDKITQSLRHISHLVKKVQEGETSLPNAWNEFTHSRYFHDNREIEMHGGKVTHHISLGTWTEGEERTFFLAYRYHHQGRDRSFLIKLEDANEEILRLRRDHPRYAAQLASAKELLPLAAEGTKTEISIFSPTAPGDVKGTQIAFDRDGQLQSFRNVIVPELAIELDPEDVSEKDLDQLFEGMIQAVAQHVQERHEDYLDNAKSTLGNLGYESDLHLNTEETIIRLLENFVAVDPVSPELCLIFVGPEDPTPAS